MAYSIDEINDCKALYASAVHACMDIRCLCTERPERLKLYQEITRDLIRVIRNCARVLKPYSDKHPPRNDLESGGVFS